ncbi:MULTISPECIES: VanZ family protein [Kurthia]|uniref:VanZ family protein n=1 Tax=Kurthia TaxID=1649 RepID=UPI00254CC296|nr:MULTISPECIES: VanZ family protein [Kurthia]MEB7772294.1 VanZ family protein [Kurthia gibsonii]WIL38787.1 VanZ family protein [Kurthia sp. YJT4]
MMAYSMPILTAAIVFGIVAVAIWIPWLIYTYRKYGYLPLSVLVISFSFIFYSLAAFFLVILPLPATRDTCAMQAPNTQHYSLVPFKFIEDTLKGNWLDIKNPATYVLLFKQPAFYQTFFNFLLLLPLGVYLRYYLVEKAYWWKATIVLFCTTLFFEITQLTGIYGIYNCAYRLFDVDDLMMNTFGGVIGYFIAPAVLAVFPSKKTIEERAAYLVEKDEVKPMSVLLAILIDLFLVDLSRQWIMVFTKHNEVTSFIVTTLLLIVFLVLIPIIWNGRTLGTAVMRFRYSSKLSKKTTISRLIKRFIAIYVAYFVGVIAGTLDNIHVTMNSPYYEASVFLALGSTIIFFILTIVIFIHIMLVIFGKGKRRFFFDEAANLFTTRK